MLLCGADCNANCHGREGQAIRDPRSAQLFEWDAGNEDKLAAREITPEMIERIFDNDPVFRRNKRGRAGIWLMMGQDPVSGRRLKVAIRWSDAAAGVLRAITAFDVDT